LAIVVRRLLGFEHTMAPALESLRDVERWFREQAADL